MLNIKFVQNHYKKYVQQWLEQGAQTSDLVHELQHADVHGSLRACYVLQLLLEKKLGNVPQYAHVFLTLLKHNNPSIQRNAARLVQYLSLNNDQISEYYPLFLNWIENTEIPTATRAYSIEILNNICEQYPELAQEIAPVLQQRMTYELPSYKYQCRKFLAKYNV